MRLRIQVDQQIVDDVGGQSRRMDFDQLDQLCGGHK